MVQTFVGEFFRTSPRKGVNPDEVVAVGAALQAALLSEDTQGPLLVDVTPLSLGIATYGGQCARMIERNTTVPCSRREIFTTTRENQSTVKIRVLQGENDQARENDLLGEFALAGVRQGPVGEPEIEVTFDIDVNGIVSVSAKDLATNEVQSIQVNPRGTLSQDELAKIAEDFETDELKVKG